MEGFGWSNDQTNICDHCLEVSYDQVEKGNYYFTYHFGGDLGCSEIHQFIVQYSEDSLYIPNAFTPNGDRVNDYFEINAPNYEIENLQIYNRWGDQIFSSAGPDFQWNGQIAAQKAEPGVYMYRVLLQGADGKTRQETGTVHLIR